MLALTGKIPSAVRRMVSVSRTAQEFLYTVSQMALTDRECARLTQALGQLRTRA